MDLGLDGRVALVTGGDSGIGWHTARELLAEGATVVLSDLDQAELDAAAARLGAPDRVHAFAADVRSTDALLALRDRVHAAVGEIDVLVPAAGTGGATGEFADLDDDEWRETLEVDLLGPVRTVRAFLADLRRGWGRIVFVTSENAVQPYADEIPYDAAKAGLLATAKALSRSVAAEGLLVNCVSPAFIATPMTDEMMRERSGERRESFDDAVRSFLQEERPHLELDRRGRPEEVAAVIAFLCSERASFVTGSNYRVDAGSVATI